MWTFFLLKPDSVRRHLVDSIRERILSWGFEVREEFSLRLDEHTILELYERFVFSILPADQKATVIKYTNQYLTDSFCVYVEVTLRPDSGRPSDVFQLARSVRGERFLPEKCSPGSIRYDFRDLTSPVERSIVGVTPIGVPLVQGVVHNLVHCPETSDERDHQSPILKRLRSEL